MFSAWAAHKCWTIEPMRRREREFERLQRAECSLPLAESANDKLVLRFFDGCSEEWSNVLITLQSQRVHLLGKLNVFFSTQHWFKKGQTHPLGQINQENICICPNNGLKYVIFWRIYRNIISHNALRMTFFSKPFHV